jgi:hypothetical protein
MEDHAFLFIKDWMWKENPLLSEQEINEKVAMFMNTHLEDIEGIYSDENEDCDSCGS